MHQLSLPSGWIHRHYDSVASTMLCCDPSALAPGQFLLVTADEQTAGRGQRGTTWESTRGENLTFNVGWKAPEGPWPAANEQFLISEITALAVLRAIEDTLSAHTSPPPIGGSWRGAITVKWPNDIYVGDRKICGMLLEHQLSGRRIESSIAGIGINVNQLAFATEAGKAEGRGAPISLRQMVGHEVCREAVLERFAHHFMEGVGMLQQGRYDEVEHTFTTLLYRREGWHPYRDADGDFVAEFVSIARNGALTLRKAPSDDDAGEPLPLCTYAFKEVTYVI